MSNSTFKSSSSGKGTVALSLARSMTQTKGPFNSTKQKIQRLSMANLLPKSLQAIFNSPESDKANTREEAAKDLTQALQKLAQLMENTHEPQARLEIDNWVRWMEQGKDGTDRARNFFQNHSLEAFLKGYVQTASLSSKIKKALERQESLEQSISTIPQLASESE